MLVSYQWLNIDIGLALRISLPIVDPMNLPSNPWEIAFAATIVAAFASWIPFAVYSLRLFARFGPFIRPADWSKGAAPLIKGMLLSALAFAFLVSLGAILQSKLGG